MNPDVVCLARFGSIWRPYKKEDRETLDRIGFVGKVFSDEDMSHLAARLSEEGIWLDRKVVDGE